MNISIKIFENVVGDSPSLPDMYKFDRSAGVISPRNDFIISRDDEGRTLSHYYDDIWDITPYTSIGIKKLIFENITDEKDREDAKRVMFLLMLFGNGKSGVILSPASLYGYFQGTLVPLANYAKEENMSMKDVLENSEKLEEYGDKIILHRPSKVQTLLSLLSFLSRVDPKNSGINYRDNSKLTKRLYHAYMKEYVLEQTPVIPVSIFLKATRNRWDHFYLVEKNISSLLKFISLCVKNPFYARRDNGYVAIDGKQVYFNKTFDKHVFWHDAVEKNRLKNFFEIYEINSRHDLQVFLSQFFFTCKHLILAYTGMRSGEAQLLQPDCFLENKMGKTTHIVGISTKVSGVPQKMNWVTVPEIKRVIGTVIKLGEAIISERDSLIKERPLFVSPLLLNFEIKMKKGVSLWKSISAGMERSAPELPLEKDSTLISENHIVELENIAPERNWRDDSDFQVGKPWKFKFHQYRRSLAVYALNSGVVSTVALQTQFGHLFKEMTAYYGNGSGSAKNLIGTDSPDHIKSEIKRLKPQFDFLAYSLNVLFSREPLYGAHGVLVQKNEVGMRDYILKNRKKTMEKFENGLLRYQETALGGCTTIEPCDSHLMGSIVNCIGCEGAGIKKSRLISTIQQQRRLVSSLSKESLEYRTESRDLKILEEYLEIIERKENGKETA